MSSKTIKCPICGKLFSTKNSLQQHERDTHGNGTGGNGKVGRPTKARSFRRRRFRGRGSNAMVKSSEGSRRAGASFNGTGAAELIPKGNPGSVFKERLYYGVSGSHDSCHKFVDLCQRLGCSRDGAIFVLKNIHPNCDEIVAFSGIPDKTAGRIYPLEMRTLKEYTQTGTGTWDLAIVSRWAPNVSNVNFQKASSQAKWSKPTTSRSSMSVSSVKDILKYRVAYGGMTIYLSASANQTEGMVYCGNKTPELGLQISDESPSDKSVKTYWRELSGKWDSEDLFSSDPGFYINQSWKGVYGRMFNTGDSYTWVSSTDNTNTERNGWTIQGPLGVEYVIEDGAGADDLFVPDIGSMVPPQISNVYTLLTGLDPKAKVVVKTRVGYEIIPKPGGLATYGMRYTPDYDDVAMDIAAELMKGLPSGVPASENDLSSVLLAASDVLLDALSMAPNPALRGVGAIGKIIRGLFK